MKPAVGAVKIEKTQKRSSLLCANASISKIIISSILNQIKSSSISYETHSNNIMYIYIYIYIYTLYIYTYICL